MTENSRHKKKEQILEELKEEIFQELDRRIKNTEKNLTEEITHVEEVFEEKYTDELIQHLEGTKKWRTRVKQDLKNMQNRLTYFRLPYAIMVVSGFMLFWYGTYNLIPRIPYLSDGPTAMISGLILLLLTGATHKKLVG